VPRRDGTRRDETGEAEEKRGARWTLRAPSPQSVPPREDRSREEVKHEAERAEGSATRNVAGASALSSRSYSRRAPQATIHIESLRHAAAALSCAPTLK